MNRTIFGFFISVCILITGIIDVNAETVTLVYPSNITGGQMFDVNVIIDPDGTAITGAQLGLEFNKSSILINSIKEGNFLKQGGTTTSFNSGTISNSMGKVENIYGAILGPNNVSTSGTFIIINATAIVSTDTPDINLTNVLVVNPLGERIYPIPSTIHPDGTSMAPGGGDAPEGDGSGGSSGGSSGENYANIEFTEIYDKVIFMNVTCSYRFTKNDNPIIYVNITGNINSIETATTVEGLYGTSSRVKTPSPGSVYKNINIFVGTFGNITPLNIKHVEIIFKVPLSWMEEYNIDPESIVMMRYDNDWKTLPTTKIGIYNGRIIYEASTIGFSPFAITGKKADAQIIYDNYRKNQGNIILESQEQDPQNIGMNSSGSLPESSNKTLLIVAFAGIIIILILVYKYVLPKYSTARSDLPNIGKQK